MSAMMRAKGRQRKVTHQREHQHAGQEFRLALDHLLELHRFLEGSDCLITLVDITYFQYIYYIVSSFSELILYEYFIILIINCLSLLFSVV
jgi:hypothetical protein